MTERREPDDPAKAAVRRWVPVLLVVGFLLFIVPNAVLAFVRGDGSTWVGALLSLAFYGWLCWRLVVLVRSGAEPDARYWWVSGVGYAVFGVLGLVYEAWRGVSGDLRPSRLVFPLLVSGLGAVSLFVGKRVRERRVDR